MINNCLKTELKSVVQNDNLVKIGRSRIHINGVLTSIDLDFTNSSTSYIVGGEDDVNFLDTNTKQHTGRIRTDNLPMNTNKDYILDIDKTALFTFALGSNGTADKSVYNIDDLKFYTALTSFSTYSPNISGNLESLNTGKLINVVINNANITGSIDSLLHAFDDSARLKQGQTTKAILNLSGCSKITGNMKAIFDHVATFAFSGNKLQLALNGTNVDYTGLSSNSLTATFDGEGGYTVA